MSAKVYTTAGVTDFMDVDAKDVTGETPETVRVKILSAARLKSMFEGLNGGFNLQNLMNWVRLLVKLLTLPFKMLSSLVSGRPVAPTDGDSDDAVGEYGKPAMTSSDAGVDPAIDVAKFANDAKKSAAADVDPENDPAIDAAKFAADPADSGSADQGGGEEAGEHATANSAGAGPAAANDATFIHELLKFGGDLELELYGLPSEIKKVQEQILALLEPVLASGHKFQAPNVAEGGEESIVRTMGEEAERFCYAQRLSAKQIVFFSQQIAAKQPETIGMTPQTIVNYVDSLRRANVPGAIKEGSAFHQLAGILEADERIRAGYDRHIAATASLVQLFAQGDEARIDALREEFSLATLHAGNKLKQNEDAILRGMGPDKEKYTNVPEKDVLFYTIRTSVQALGKALTEAPKQAEVDKTAPEEPVGAKNHVETPIRGASGVAPVVSASATAKSAAPAPAPVQPGVAKSATVDRSKLSLKERAMLDAADEEEEFSDHDDERSGLVM